MLHFFAITVIWGSIIMQNRSRLYSISVHKIQIPL